MEGGWPWEEWRREIWGLLTEELKLEDPLQHNAEPLEVLVLLRDDMVWIGSLQDEFLRERLWKMRERKHKRKKEWNGMEWNGNWPRRRPERHEGSTFSCIFWVNLWREKKTEKEKETKKKSKGKWGFVLDDPVKSLVPQDSFVVSVHLKQSQNSMSFHGLMWPISPKRDQLKRQVWQVSSWEGPRGEGTISHRQLRIMVAHKFHLWRITAPAEKQEGALAVESVSWNGLLVKKRFSFGKLDKRHSFPNNLNEPEHDEGNKNVAVFPRERKGEEGKSFPNRISLNCS